MLFVQKFWCKDTKLGVKIVHFGRIQG